MTRSCLLPNIPWSTIGGHLKSCAASWRAMWIQLSFHLWICIRIRQAIRSVCSYRKCADRICWMSERHWAVSLSAMLYIYKHVQRILIFPPIIFTRDSVWIVKSLRDWYSIPWIIFRERVCDLSVAACRRLISVIITVVRTAVGTAMPIIMKNRLRKE